MSSVLQGSGLCLRWRAGRDRDGSAVRQGPGRPLLCQSGPKQRLDRHSPPDLASALPLQALLQPTCLSYLPVCLTDTQSVVNCNTSTWPDSPAARLLGRFTPTTTWETMADVQVATLKVWACSDTTALSLVGQYKAHITFTATTMRRRIKEKKKKKRANLWIFIRWAGLRRQLDCFASSCRILHLNFPSASSTLTSTQSPNTDL